MVHLKNVTSTPICLKLQGIKMQKIENLKDSFVKVYDYVIQGRLGFSEVIKNKYFNLF